MKYMAIIDADEKPVSCEFIGCNGNVTPYLIGATTNIKPLEQEPCEDAISKQSVINAIANTCFWLSADNWAELTKCINSLPHVTSQSKTGILDKIRAEIEEIEKNYGLDKATKYGNENAEQQRLSYSTMMMYEVADLVDDIKEIIDKYKAKAEWLTELKKLKEPTWIPVSEGLPNLDDYTGSKTWQKEVLITGYLTFDGPKDLFVSEVFAEDVTYNRVPDTIVLAWMPKPEPYKAERSSEDENTV